MKPKKGIVIRPMALGAMLVAGALGVAAWAQPATSQPSTGGFTMIPVESAPVERIDPTYQWSVEVAPVGHDRRAYLWIPLKCQRVRGLVVGMQNMLEKPMFQNGDFRDALAACDLGIVFIAPGSVGKDDPALSLGFKDAKAGVAQLQSVLSRLAAESGYSEVATVPLIPVGHSAATPFVWGYTWLNPGRCIACIPYKGWFQNAASSVPYLHVSSEWAEVGGPQWGTTWEKKDRGSLLKIRATRENPMIGEFAEIGNGHFAWQPASGKILGMFIMKVVAARLSTNTQSSETSLKPLVIDSGVLVNPDDLGRPSFKAYRYDQYPGEKEGAYWYIDEEMARTTSDYMKQQLARKPQVIDCMVNGKPAPLDQRGMAEVGVKLLDDGVTWKVQACFLEKAPAQLQYGDDPLGHASGPGYFRAGSGAIRQVGVDTFQVWLERGSVERQGNPWDPWAIATHPGDSEYRSADRPIHFWIDIRRKDGKPQTIDFPQIPNQPSTARSVQLGAKASSGLPVQYFVISGPARIKGDDTLEFLPIPPRTRFPVKVMVGAFQWGRGNGEKVRTAGPEVREMLIEDKTGADRHD